MPKAIIIPNSRFADSIMTNVNLPEAPTNIVIPVAISYASDPRRVESVLRDEAQRAIADLPELVKDFEPIVRLQAFGQSSLDLQVVVRVRDFDAQFPIWGELHQRLFARLQREAISIPFNAHRPPDRDTAGSTGILTPGPRRGLRRVPLPHGWMTPSSTPPLTAQTDCLSISDVPSD